MFYNAVPSVTETGVCMYVKLNYLFELANSSSKKYLYVDTWQKVDHIRKLNSALCFK